jgi:hypothetical protein
MKKLTFRGAMISGAVLSGLLTALTALGYAFFCTGWLLSTAITFGTVFYHFAMRLTVGALVPATFDHRSAWFQPKTFEAKLYRRLRVKKWKNRMPTYDPQLFSMPDNTMDAIVSHMCQAEVVHEIIIVCSFLPLLFSLLWGSFWVFFITSVLAAAIDTSFVIMQRYNRPRVEQLINKYTSRRDTL